MCLCTSAHKEPIASPWCSCGLSQFGCPGPSRHGERWTPFAFILLLHYQPQCSHSNFRGLWLETENYLMWTHWVNQPACHYTKQRDFTVQEFEGQLLSLWKSAPLYGNQLHHFNTLIIYLLQAWHGSLILWLKWHLRPPKQVCAFSTASLLQQEKTGWELVMAWGLLVFLGWFWTA